MAINTELPISKVTFDDQEISLASSGGGGEEVKQETYAGTDISNIYTRLVELMNNGKLIGVNIKATSTVTYTGNRVTHSGSFQYYNDMTYTYAPSDIIRAVPSLQRQSSNAVYLSSASGNSQAMIISITNSNVKVSHSNVNINYDLKIVNMYSAFAELPLNSLEFTLHYFA